MSHFIQYHNPDVMDPYVPSKKGFGIVTNKRAGLREGDTVWLVTGEGKPRRYFFCETFEVAQIVHQSAGIFRYRASGTNGNALYPLKIDKSAWFSELLKITGNFRYGLQRIKSQSVVNALEQVLSKRSNDL